ncbi:hypothetical protein LZ31DRAFT_372112 [Colletotrichum somersetense]|nr:hypothetical protein LZ31DRAFT_372112 [Colletotrichum somersetense]
MRMPVDQASSPGAPGPVERRMPAVEERNMISRPRRPTTFISVSNPATCSTKPMNVPNSPRSVPLSKLPSDSNLTERRKPPPHQAVRLRFGVASPPLCQSFPA